MSIKSAPRCMHVALQTLASTETQHEHGRTRALSICLYENARCAVVTTLTNPHISPSGPHNTMPSGLANPITHCATRFPASPDGWNSEPLSPD